MHHNYIFQAAVNITKERCHYASKINKSFNFKHYQKNFQNRIITKFILQNCLFLRDTSIMLRL